MPLILLSDTSAGKLTTGLVLLLRNLSLSHIASCCVLLRALVGANGITLFTLPCVTSLGLWGLEGRPAVYLPSTQGSGLGLC